MTSRHAPGGVQGLLGITPDLTTFGKQLGRGFSL
jgi:glutamate-1-semialdehyde 2,1-aminomutase